MVMEESNAPSTPPIRRSNSIATSVMIPVKLTLPSKPLRTSSLDLPYTNGVASSPPTGLGLELVSAKSSLTYTSLKDVLVFSSVNSPTAVSGSACEISIRNRLVKQAAWAYLQPMSSSPSSSGTHFLHRVWLQFSARNPFSACFGFISRHFLPTIAGAINRVLSVFWVHLNR
ncbi:hypothetical protein K2173_010454 [Erythroxylum novogranatense]|uniref:Uncharacterized protein n=1 Tax=Erythroxylum novogranatense TaxID=1862640 RepID=A0AAV8UCQ6_9ROSI|nr:hypothetical protein K2173_010454 [Erythroxylum novogranatense]